MALAKDALYEPADWYRAEELLEAYRRDVAGLPQPGGSHLHTSASRDAAVRRRHEELLDLIAAGRRASERAKAADW